MTIDPDDAYAQIDAIFINHPKFALVRQEVRHIIQLPHTKTAPCIHVSGPSGVGKSTLRDCIKAEYPPEADGAEVLLLGGVRMTTDRYEVLIIRMPSSPTVKALAREILKAYGDELWNRGDEYTLGDRVDRYIAASRTRAILIDEAQRAVERSGTVVSDKLIDWIKSRHETNSVAFILLGLGSLQHLFQADRQIQRRWDAEIRLAPYRWHRPDGTPDISGQDDFIALLATFRDLTPIPFDFDIESDEVAFRFFYLSRGLIDGVKKVLLMSARLMKHNGQTSIDIQLLKQAAAAAFPLEDTGMQNPFSEDFIAIAPPPLEDDYEVRIAKSRAKKGKGGKKLSTKRLNQAVISQLVK